MIFPVGDDQVKGGSFPLFSYAFLGLNIMVWIYQASLGLNTQEGVQFVYEYGGIPVEITNGKDIYTLLTNMFLHGGWMHLIGNMMFLFVFADNIEAVIGNVKFVLFYLFGGIAASLAHAYVNPSSLIPAVGASGAISAILGAYLVMFPKSRIKMLVIYFFRTFRIPAIAFLGFWILQQFIAGFSAMGAETANTGGTAWWAHIGGFLFGAVMGILMRKRYGDIALSIAENTSIGSNRNQGPTPSGRYPQYL